MTAPKSMNPAEFLREQLESASPDVLRAMVKTFAEALMGAEADAICGAPYGVRSEDRVNSRNGYRPREWDTRAGTIELAFTAGKEFTNPAGNVLVGRARDGEARFGPLALPIPGEAPHEEGAHVQLLFRPEHVTLTATEPDAGSPVLGQGTVFEQNFSGPLRRLRLRLPRLTATRQVAPPIPFGEEDMLVDAVTSSDVPLDGGPLWVSLRDYRILRQPKADRVRLGVDRQFQPAGQRLDLSRGRRPCRVLDGDGHVVARRQIHQIRLQTLVQRHQVGRDADCAGAFHGIAGAHQQQRQGKVNPARLGLHFLQGAVEVDVLAVGALEASTDDAVAV